MKRVVVNSFDINSIDDSLVLKFVVSKGPYEVMTAKVGDIGEKFKEYKIVNPDSSHWVQRLCERGVHGVYTGRVRHYEYVKFYNARGFFEDARWTVARFIKATHVRAYNGTLGPYSNGFELDMRGEEVWVIQLGEVVQVHTPVKQKQEDKKVPAPRGNSSRAKKAPDVLTYEASEGSAAEEKELAAMKAVIKKLKSEKSNLAALLRDRPLVEQVIAEASPPQPFVALPSAAPPAFLQPLPAPVQAPPPASVLAAPPRYPAPVQAPPASALGAPPRYSWADVPAHPPTAPLRQHAVGTYFDRQVDICNSYDNAMARDDILELHQRHRNELAEQRKEFYGQRRIQRAELSSRNRDYLILARQQCYYDLGP